MRPKFEVGEVVLLQSVMLPECNGEYTVLARECGRYRVPSGELYEGFKYLLDDDNKDGWVERSLRKKHQPGELSFEELMHSLSSPKMLTHQPQ